MPKRTPRIGVGINAGNVFEIGEVQRSRIEKAFGHRLNSEVWKQVEMWTTLLTGTAPIEKKAASITQTSKKLDKLIKAAISLRKDLSSKPKPPSRGNSIKDIYKDYFEVDIKDLSPDHTFEFVLDIVDGVIALSEFMQRAMKQDLQGFHEGFAWELWVRKLTEVFVANKLPTAASKNSSTRKYGTPSAFVTFIREMQKEIPEGCRKTNNEQSIATAIYRARR